VCVGSRPSSELKVLQKLFSYPYGLGKEAAAYVYEGSQQFVINSCWVARTEELKGVAQQKNESIT